MAELRALGDIGGEQRESLTFMVLVGGREGALVDMVGQEAMEGVLKGGEGCLVIRVQDRSLMFVQMLQEAVGGVRPHMGGRARETAPGPQPRATNTAEESGANLPPCGPLVPWFPWLWTKVNRQQQGKEKPRKVRGHHSCLEDPKKKGRG